MFQRVYLTGFESKSTMCTEMPNSSGRRAVVIVTIRNFHRIFLGKSVIYVVVAFSISAGEDVSSIKFELRTAPRVRKPISIELNTLMKIYPV